MHQLDPDFLPETRGTLVRFLLNPKADIDGLLLDDGTEVHTPPHLSAQLSHALRLGDTVSLRGVKLRQADVIVAVAIDPAQGPRILDQGPSDHVGKPTRRPDVDRHATEYTGTIQALLHGPKGDVHGVLLAEGIIVRFPPHNAKALLKLLQVGAPLSVQGVVCVSPQGRVIEANALGNHPSSLTEIAKDPKPHPKKPPKGPGPKGHHPHT